MASRMQSEGSGGAPQLDEQALEEAWLAAQVWPNSEMAERVEAAIQTYLAASPGAGELDQIEERLKRTVDEFFPLAEKWHNDAFKEALVAAMRGGRDD